MTEENITLSEKLLQPVLENGLEGLALAMTTLLNTAMEIERMKALGISKEYERSDARRGQSNGFKNKPFSTRVGELSLRIPQVRGDIKFYPSALERGQRSERALAVAMAEAYVQGVSTAKVSSILEKLCGFEVSASQVSNAAKELDASLEKWRNRPLGEYEYLILDARYEKVRVDGVVRSCALLIAYGIMPDGRRSILGASVSLSELEIHWRNFLMSLKKRGLYGLKMITSDDHSGLKAALQCAFPGIPVQRCQVHLQRNAAAYVPKKEILSEVASTLRTIFRAPDINEANRLLDIACEKYSKSASKLAAWMKENIPDGFAVFGIPEKHRRQLATTNLAEAVNKIVKKRTRVAGIFPNEDSLLRLASAVLSEIDDRWAVEKKYLARTN